MKPIALVVEDDPLVLEIIEANLPLDGWEVVSAAGGAAALSLLETLTPDVVVLDLLLPDANGLELCQQIRASNGRLASLPVLMLTALAMQSDKLAGFSAGASGWR
jgi:DNA-binding response OmpR family regulator